MLGNGNVACVILAVCLLAGGSVGDTGKYDFGPVSYDLSDLPPMDNEIYAEWDGDIYFRQYSDEDIESGALWGDFSPVADTEKELMCMDAEGSIVQVGVDSGCGNMFIVDGRIYSQSYSAIKGYQVYSCGLDGEDRIIYQSGKVLDVNGGKVICQKGHDYGGLYCIDTQSGQKQVLTKGHKWCQYLGADEEGIFFYGYQVNEETGTEELVLYSADYEGNIEMLRMFPREEYIEIMGEWNLYQYPLEIYDFKIVEDMIYFAAGSSNGNAKMYTGGPIYSMKRDGSNAKVEAVAFDDFFYLYDDGDNRVIYYRGDDESYGSSVGDDLMRQVILYGEAPQDVVLWRSYASYDKPDTYGITGTLLFYPDTSAVCYVLLTEEECEELSVSPYVDSRRVQKIADIEYIAGKLFFTVTDLTYNAQESIGWRDYYDRGRSVCYCKDMESGKIQVLYEY